MLWNNCMLVIGQRLFVRSQIVKKYDPVFLFNVQAKYGYVRVCPS